MSLPPVYATYVCDIRQGKEIIEGTRLPLPAAIDEEFVLNTIWLFFRLFEARFGAIL
jgi:hypothetical protein